MSWKDILKNCSCEKDSNREELEKVAGGFTVALAPALYQPTFGRKKRKCKKCRRK